MCEPRAVTDQELYDLIYDGICRYKDKHYEEMGEYFTKSKGLPEKEREALFKQVHPYHFPYEAYVELEKDIVRVIYDDRLKDTGKRKVFSKGTKMRVVLASNMEKMNRSQFVGTSAAVLGAAGLRLPVWAQAGATASAGVPLLLGVDYYPDQTPESLWEEDARKISEAGLTNVRIAEFAWALMEPAEGKFDFAWLQRAVDILHGNNIAVILGTPSAAPPPWLTVKYPDVVEVNEKGEKLRPGGRRFTCPTNGTYRRLSLAIATEMARKFAAHPGVIGWQIDNEFTLGSSPRCYCDFCRAGFQAWVRSKYGTLDKINQAWGTNFWSQRYTDWAQIPVPLPSGADPNPGLALDYARYQSFANASFLGEQLAMLRKLCPKHYVTTNNIGVPYDVIDDRELFAKLDFVSFDNYPGFFDMLLHQGGQSGSLLSDVIPATIAMQHDFGRSILRKPFVIMEEQSGKAGQPTFSPQPEPGQVRLWSYQGVAHGAMGINYFRWDTATFGAEEYWHGMLNHGDSGQRAQQTSVWRFRSGSRRQRAVQAWRPGTPAGQAL